MGWKFNPFTGKLDVVSVADSPVVVADGGTGITSATAYAVICAGTTSTNAFQPLSSLGTSGQVLTSGGAGVLPSWTTVAGSGDVVKVGTPVDSQIGVWTGDGTIEGDTAFTFDTSTDTLAVAASGKFNFGAVTILSDSAGTMTLSNVDALDATTEATVEAAIDTLANLTSAAALATVGTITTGTWQGTTIAVDQGGTGQTSYTDGQLLVGNSTGNTLAKATITGTANEIDVTNGSGSITLDLSDTVDLGGKTSFEIPNSATPTVNADGEIALDTTVTDFSHGIIKYYGGEEMAVVAMPIAELTSPTDTHVVTYNATNDEFELAAGGSGGGFQAEINIPFAAMRVNTTTAFAPIEYVDLGTVEDLMAAYDGAADEYRQGTFACPSDIDSSGTVTFEIYGKRASGTGAANVVFDFDHRAVADSEAGDGSYTTEGSGALAVDTTAGDLDRLTWTESVTNLGWTANDLIIFRVGRQGADASDTLNSVDYYAWNFRILIPRA